MIEIETEVAVFLAYFPLFIDLRDKTVLIVGGGPVAARKIQTLLEFHPKIVVCALQFTPELEAMDGIALLQRPFTPDLLQNVSLAIAATDDRTVNCKVAQLCREQSIPVNVADNQGESTFLFPSIVQRGPMTVGISTSGTSPAASAWVRKTLEAALPPSLGAILEWLAEIRSSIKQSLPPKTHQTAFTQLFSAACKAARPLTSQETAIILQDIQKEAQ